MCIQLGWARVIVKAIVFDWHHFIIKPFMSPQEMLVRITLH